VPVLGRRLAQVPDVAVRVLGVVVVGDLGRRAVHRDLVVHDARDDAVRDQLRPVGHGDDVALRADAVGPVAAHGEREVGVVDVRARRGEREGDGGGGEHGGRDTLRA
jgi:hypothetical protein